MHFITDGFPTPAVPSNPFIFVLDPIATKLVSFMKIIFTWESYGVSR